MDAIAVLITKMQQLKHREVRGADWVQKGITLKVNP